MGNPPSAIRPRGSGLGNRVGDLFGRRPAADVGCHAIATLRAAGEEIIHTLKLNKFRAAIDVGSETQATRRAENASIAKY